MACLFQLAIECGNDNNVALQIKKICDNQVFILKDSKSYSFNVDEVMEDEQKRWWVSIIVSNGSRFLQFIDDRILLAQAGEKMYELLKSVCGYRFALTGFEVFQFNKLESLQALIASPGMAGLVVNADLYSQIGCPSGFMVFSEGYYWLPSDFNYL